MGFSIADRGAPPPAPAGRPQPRLALLGHTWKDYTETGFYEPVKAVTRDGGWIFERQPGGTWKAGHLPSETAVKDGLRSLEACRRYVAGGGAQNDLDRLLAEDEGGSRG